MAEDDHQEQEQGHEGEKTIKRKAGGKGDMVIPREGFEGFGQNPPGGFDG